MSELNFQWQKFKMENSAKDVAIKETSKQVAMLGVNLISIICLIKFFIVLIIYLAFYYIIVMLLIKNIHWMNLYNTYHFLPLSHQK